MLAATEVNGCALCAYAHTKFALEAGMEMAEIRDMLSGVAGDVPDRELPVIAFAQHYADSRGQPDRTAWDRLVEVYSVSEAVGVLGAARGMMWGNVAGLPLTALRDRRRGTPHRGSSLRYEIGAPPGSDCDRADSPVPRGVLRAPARTTPAVTGAC